MFRLPESSEISTMQITRLPGRSRKSLLVTDALRSPPFFFFFKKRWAGSSHRGGHRRRGLKVQTVRVKVCKKQSTVTRLGFITEHSHIQTFSPLALSPTTAAVLLSCLMWSLSPHVTISFPLFSPPSFYLLSSCFNPSVFFSSFIFHLFSSFFFTCALFFPPPFSPFLFFPALFMNLLISSFHLCYSFMYHS